MMADLCYAPQPAESEHLVCLKFPGQQRHEEKLFSENPSLSASHRQMNVIGASEVWTLASEMKVLPLVAAHLR
jgi:hypothetical protein